MMNQEEDAQKAAAERTRTKVIGKPFIQAPI